MMLKTIGAIVLVVIVFSLMIAFMAKGANS